MGPVIIDIQGFKLTTVEVQLLQKPACGGVILFTRNFENNQQLKELVLSIRKINPQLLITVDHEGGKVQRFRQGFTQLPPARDYGLMYQESPEKALSYAHAQGYIMASELLDYGIDLSFAPVLDRLGPSEVIAKYNRAFDASSEVIINIGRAFIQGMNAAGMKAVGKHFPGHGSCQLDSHVARPVDDRQIVELLEDRRPFEVLMREGLLVATMPAHVCYPAIDADNIVTYSKTWLQTILREEIGFKGVVISDCISMAGSACEGHSDNPYLNRLKAALNYCDVVIMSHMTDLNLVASLLDAVSDTTCDKLSMLRGNWSEDFRQQLDHFNQVIVEEGSEPRQGNKNLAQNLFS